MKPPGMPADISARLEEAVRVVAQGGGLIGVAIVVVAPDGTTKAAGTGEAVQWPTVMRTAARLIEQQDLDS